MTEQENPARPTKLSFWWRKPPPGEDEPYCVRVVMGADGVLRFPEVQGWNVTADGRWLCEIPSPDRIAALERCAEVLARSIEVLDVEGMHCGVDVLAGDGRDALAALRETEQP